MAGGLPALLGKPLSRRWMRCWTSCRPTRRRPGAPSVETIDEESGQAEGHDAERPRDRHDARLQRAAQSGLRLLDQARTGQALAARAGWLVDAGLPDRFAGGRRLPVRMAACPQRVRDGDGRHLSRDRPARTAWSAPNPSTRNGTRATRSTRWCSPNEAARPRSRRPSSTNPGRPATWRSASEMEKGVTANFDRLAESVGIGSHHDRRLTPSRFAINIRIAEESNIKEI